MNALSLRRRPKVRDHNGRYALPPGPDSYEAHAKVPATCGVWIVCKMPPNTEPGFWPHGRWGHEKVDAAFMDLGIQAASNGIAAIQRAYNEELSHDDSRKSAADGRYVALDFVTGQRVEALVVGGWQVNLDVEDGSGRTGKASDD